MIEQRAKSEEQGRPLWSLVAESFQDAARERGLIGPASRCLPPPFGCGEKPANSYGLCVDCVFELITEFDLAQVLNLSDSTGRLLSSPLDIVETKTGKEGESEGEKAAPGADPKSTTSCGFSGIGEKAVNRT